MLRLERLEISGFKSFLESAALSFPGSVTAVIGPNGCGKSNICDAVAWVLGEQSARILRGEKMDDVIFNGSARRRALGMAEVTLTLRSQNGDFPETDGRIAIGRRVYRDGQGEYFLNGKKVRLRDVQEVLFGTGLGVRAYSIIEQGKIDQVLSSKPQDRRRLIEEAAGITKYKIKKRAAELKLEETRANLTRLTDILIEVERSCHSLKRQASRAERYKERTELLRQKRAILTRLRYNALAEQNEKAARELADLRDAEARAGAELGQGESKEAEARRISLDSRMASEAARDRLSALTSAVERDDSAIESARRAETEIGGRRGALARTLQDLTADAEQRKTQRRELQIRLKDLRAGTASAEEERKAAAAEKSRIETELVRLEERLAQAQGEIVSAAGERVRSRNALHELDLALERVSAGQSRLSETRSRQSAALEAMEAEIRSAEAEGARLQRGARGAASAAEKGSLQFEEASRGITAREQTKAERREEAAALEHRARTLEEVRDARAEVTEAASRHLRERRIAIRGLLGSALKARPGWEEVLDRLASEELGALVVESDPDKAAAELKAAGLGGAVAGTAWKGKKPASNWEGVLENFPDLPAGVAASLPVVHFVETAKEAREGALARPGEIFAARSGEIVRGALWRVSGGRPAQSGILTLGRDLDAARARLKELSQLLSRSEKELDAERGRREKLQAELSALQEAARGAQEAAAAHEARVSERRLERDRRARELETLSAEDSMLGSEGDELTQKRGQVSQEESRLDKEEAAARAAAETLAAEAARRRPALAAAAEREAAARAAFEGARERQAACEREDGALAEQEDSAARKHSELQSEAGELATREVAAKNEAQESRKSREQHLLERERAARNFEAVSTASQKAALGAAEHEETLRKTRDFFEGARQRRFDAELSTARLTSDLEHSVADARREFGVAPEELAPAPDLSEEEFSALEGETRELSEQIEKMGPVNVLAFEEYREQSERLEFLSTQKRDLEASIASLLETIHKINATSSDRFAEAFARVNENFSQIFQRLFRGGTAEMRLLDESDLLDSGIEIIAQPPGKRNQSILLLSGGEKAMTAIALLMAIFRYKPSPFCILDEVDAPLDDANIDRFTRLIRDMVEDTQFIAITHNKRTMETADALYGVTMEEPGCSKIVSVRFD
jgi:chromosome segregation protein